MKFVVEAYCKANGSSKPMRRVGAYEALADAIAASKDTINSWLQRQFKEGMTAEKLYSDFQVSGEVPYIFRSEDYTLSSTGFNAQEYAKARCAEICSGKMSGKPNETLGTRKAEGAEKT